MLSANTWIINIHNFEFSETLCLLSCLDHLDLGLRFSSKIPLSVIIWNILPGKTPFLRISRQNFQLLSWFLSPVDRLNQKQLLFTILLNLCWPLYYFFSFVERRWQHQRVTGEAPDVSLLVRSSYTQRSACARAAYIWSVRCYKIVVITTFKLLTWAVGSSAKVSDVRIWIFSFASSLCKSAVVCR